MWIVALALRRPYTFVVMALVLIILTPIVILRTPVDIFPDINIPVVSVVWNFTGFAPRDMADRIVTNSERGMTITVNDIEHIESQSVQRRRRHQDFLPAAGQHSDGAGAGDGDRADHGARPAAGHHAAAGHHLFGVVHADRAAWPQQQDPAGTATVRPGPELPAHPTGNRAGRGHALSLRRQDTPGAG